MFEKSNKNLIKEQFGKTNRIVEGTVITGDITSLADFRLDGELNGNFISGGKIVIGPTGKVLGNITCNNADIEGRFEGTIQVTELLNIKAKASIKGEVFVGKLAVEPGADFSASCVMKDTIKTLNIKNGGKQSEEKTA
ncbi:bactofilin family protein [Flavobacterium kingsejongi]|uniref:Cell shape determination protein CcmA n=1 Tax=Flavobacterium kingsejongi TaxID=1678728 RepID=A0A2S1LLY3_9FLAO|nr:polymer-forming cytoskeletal protein [Flavobacterium kingsejongi]AWG24586.1 hypothetical protein FK004_04760 [Flavobacterium kingsejongi]